MEARGAPARQGRRDRGWASLDSLWVRDLGLESVVSIYEPENSASGAVMRRLGFSLERETRHPTHGVHLHVMSLARHAWRPT